MIRARRFGQGDSAGEGTPIAVDNVCRQICHGRRRLSLTIIYAVVSFYPGSVTWFPPSPKVSFGFRRQVPPGLLDGSDEARQRWQSNLADLHPVPHGLQLPVSRQLVFPLGCQQNRPCVGGPFW